MVDINNPSQAPPNPSANEKFEQLSKRVQRILFKTSSLFPFTLFPDEIAIDQCKVNIVLRAFFYSEDIHSITVDMIKDVEVETSVFFATFKIVPDGYPGEPISVKYLKKEDAECARRIIQGLMVAKKEGIKITEVNTSDLVKKLEDIGRARLH